MPQEDRDHPSGPPAGPEGPASPQAQSVSGPRAARLPVPPDPLLDAAIRALQRGEGGEEHEERTFKALEPPLLTLFANRGCEPDEAENLTQEVLVRVFENIEDYRWQGTFWAWIKRIAVNVLSNHLRDQEALKRRADRRVSRDRAASDDEERQWMSERPEAHEVPVALEGLLAAERSLRLRDALPQLPERMREVVALRIGGLTYEEIAETLGVGLNTVRSQLNGSKKRLRRILAATYPELDDGEEP